MDVSAKDEKENFFEEHKLCTNVISLFTSAESAVGGNAETIGGVGSTAVLANGLITEEVFTVQAAAELLEKTKHVVDAVHHGEAQKMLLPIKRG